MQEPIRDGDLDVLDRIDAGQFGPDHMRLLVLELIHPDQVVQMERASAARSSGRRERPDPFVEHPVHSARPEADLDMMITGFACAHADLLVWVPVFGSDASRICWRPGW